MMNNWQLLVFAGYFLVFVSAAFGVAIWLSKRNDGKPPLEFKLLRGPGESLRKRMNQFNEDILAHLYYAAATPVMAACGIFFLLVWLNPRLRLPPALLIITVGTLPVLFFSGRWIVRKFLRYRDDRLGYLGERVVGESLQPLEAAGCRIFHDIPAEAAGKKFNIDHAVIGPNGVFAIETKTRRKGRARPGFEAHKVAYDGRQLIWPWGKDDFGLRNAESRARWLADWLNQVTGLSIVAKPVLALPGWYVVSKGIGAVTVLNHKQLEVSILRDRSNAPLSEREIDLIARQLDQRCRDVDD